MSWFRKMSAPAPSPEGIRSMFSTGQSFSGVSRVMSMQAALAKTFQRKPPAASPIAGTAMDGLESSASTFGGMYNIVSDAQLGFFSAQGFLGYQILAMLSQHWLIDKACTMPAIDAVRNGWEITSNSGVEIDTKEFDAIRKADERMGITKAAIEFARMGRVFGIRLAMAEVEGIEYEKPFNPDGVREGSYKGLTQIDPYWIIPEFSGEAISNPLARDFYEPTWWSINGRRIHRSHFIIYNASPVADILKPTYMYGGLSIPQKIYERVYAAERTANEAPQIAMTKRLNVLKTNVAQALANQGEFEQEMQRWTQLRDNYGVKVIGQDDTIEQHDSNLSNLDETIMTQYQLVAAASGVPATKLLGTTPKGFNSSGGYEESSYHEELESVQANIRPLLERHYVCLVRSEFPKLKSAGITIAWESLDSPTAKEWAEINEIQARTDAALVGTGAITGAEVLARIVKDKHSGYNGLTFEDEGEADEDAD